MVRMCQMLTCWIQSDEVHISILDAQGFILKLTGGKSIPVPIPATCTGCGNPHHSLDKQHKHHTDDERIYNI